MQPYPNIRFQARKSLTIATIIKPAYDLYKQKLAF